MQISRQGCNQTFPCWRISFHCWDIVEKGLVNNGPWLLGDKLSDADFHLFMIAHWSQQYASRAQDWIHINAHYQAMLNRASIQEMMAQEGLL